MCLVLTVFRLGGMLLRSILVLLSPILLTLYPHHLL